MYVTMRYLNATHLVLNFKLNAKDGACTVDSVQTLYLFHCFLEFLHRVNAEPQYIAATLWTYHVIIVNIMYVMILIYVHVLCWTSVCNKTIETLHKIHKFKLKIMSNSKIRYNEDDTCKVIRIMSIVSQQVFLFSVFISFSGLGYYPKVGTRPSAVYYGTILSLLRGPTPTSLTHEKRK